MPFSLSEAAELYASQTNVQQQMILEIEGIPYIFGAVAVLKVPRYGQDDLVYGLEGLVYGENLPRDDQKDYISLTGTTQTLTQQLEQDKGGVNSVSTMKVSLVDNNGELTEIFRPGENVADLLGRKAKLYIGFVEGAFPEDTIEIFSGIISTYSSDSTNVYVTVNHPDQLKRQSIFIASSTILSGAISDSATTINVDSTSGFLTEGDSVETYIIIEDEIIRYTGLTSTSFTGCTRGALGTIAFTHDDEADVNSRYRLQGNMTDLSLKMMLSGGVRLTEGATSFNFQPDGSTISNTITFDFNITNKMGATVGDLITTTGATNGANNFVDKEILSIQETINGTYVLMDGVSLVNELETSATISLKSKYDTMPEGTRLEMQLDQVDVSEHERVQRLYGTSHHTYDFLLEDEIEAKTFLDTQIYFPSGCYGIPRKGRCSLGSTTPPILDDQVVRITSEDVINPSKIKISRSISKNFYNAVIQSYQKSRLDDKYLKNRVTYSSDSSTRIEVGNRPLVIQADGVRDGAESTLDVQAGRFISRYRYSAEYLELQLLFNKGFNLEAGDKVIFDGANLGISDITQGNKDFQPRIMEITNKSYSFKSGDIKVILTDTSYNAEGKFITISPASLITSGTTTDLILEKNYTSSGLERSKWQDYFNLGAVVRSNDYTSNQSTTLLGFLNYNNKGLEVSAISTPPLANYVIEPPTYDNADAEYKLLHGFLSPTVQVATGISSTQFTVADPSVFFVGCDVIVRLDNWSTTSGYVEVTDITGTTITVEDMGFTPDNTYRVDVSGFASDSEAGYQIL